MPLPTGARVSSSAPAGVSGLGAGAAETGSAGVNVNRTSTAVSSATIHGRRGAAGMSVMVGFCSGCDS